MARKNTAISSLRFEGSGPHKERFLFEEPSTSLETTQAPILFRPEATPSEVESVLTLVPTSSPPPSIAGPHEFIHRVILRHVTTEALQRSGVYARSADVHLRAQFNIAARTALLELGDRYSLEDSTPDSWLHEIQTIRDALGSRFKDHLASGRVRFGIVQRMVALYLKHRWLLGDENKRPLFSVVDRWVMAQARVPDPPNWSELDSVSDYLRIVDWIEAVATGKGYSSSAEWEATECRQPDDDLDFS